MSDPDNADLLYGASAIASFIRLSPKKVYHLVARGNLPTFKIGGKRCARKSSLSKWLEDQEKAANS